MEQSIIVVYVDNSGRRRWAGPFKNDNAAFDFQILGVQRGTIRAACNVDVQKGWADAYGGSS